MSPMGKCLMDVVKKFLVKFPVVQLLTWSICQWSSSHLVNILQGQLGPSEYRLCTQHNL